MNIHLAVERLNNQLPLKARQDQLMTSLKKLHQLILMSLVQRGKPPTHAELAAQVGDVQVAAALQTLGAVDLIVLNQQGTAAVGAYPLTTEVTPHRLIIENQSIYAMCALDAVAVAPMFATTVTINSNCHVSGEPVQICMREREMLSVQPAGVMVGIRWQKPHGFAAHNMCTEMVFCKDLVTARQWQGDEVETISLFTLAEAIAFGQAFFAPLLNA